MTSTGSIPENIRYLTGIPNRLFDFLSIHFFVGLMRATSSSEAINFILNGDIYRIIESCREVVFCVHQLQLSATTIWQKKLKENQVATMRRYGPIFA
jgi:hypothetical protein